MISPEPFNSYTKLFVQRIPYYGIKGRSPYSTWRTKNKPLADKPILAHLEGKYFVAVLGQWYPDFAGLDFDRKPFSCVTDTRGILGLDSSNSMLFPSESFDSYHLYFRSLYHSKPPTLRLLTAAFREFCRNRGIEIYPQRNRPFRLPFSPLQTSLDPEYSNLDSWEEKLYWFEKLEPFDLSSVKYHQLSFDFKVDTPERIEQSYNFFQEAEYLLNSGLQVSSSRHESQFKLLLYFWRKNIIQEHAEEIVWQWIRRKHNGFSKDIIRHPEVVQKEIERQAAHIWNNYQLTQTYPDSTHNLHHGWVTALDIPDIVQAVKGSLPRMKFLFHLVKYSYPRRNRQFIPVHTDKLIEFSSNRTYLKNLNELSEKGILERNSSYLPDLFAKSLKLNWKYRSSDQAVLYDNRSVDSFEDTVKLQFRPQEFRELLEGAGTHRRSRYAIIKSIWV